MELIDEQASVLADQFSNGNLGTVSAALKALDPIFSAAIAARIVHLLTAPSGLYLDGLADRFVSFLANTAERDAMESELKRNAKRG